MTVSRFEKYVQVKICILLLMNPIRFGEKQVPQFTDEQIILEL